MRIATWNVNSLKVRLPHVVQWLTQHQVEVLCLQELKLTDENFPLAALEAIGYRSVYAGQKTYNGVAILVRADITDFDEVDIVRNLPGFDDEQRRLIAATVNGVRVVSAYFPNGQAPGTEKFAYKLRWLAALETWVRGELATHERFALLGDFNIAPEDRDVHDPVRWEGQNLVSQEERASFARLIQSGLVDAYRLFEQPDKGFSWWDYRMFAFRRNAGLRIDHILLSPALVQRCTACTIDLEPRRLEQPSDHAPVVATLALQAA